MAGSVPAGRLRPHRGSAAPVRSRPGCEKVPTPRSPLGGSGGSVSGSWRLAPSGPVGGCGVDALRIRAGGGGLARGARPPRHRALFAENVGQLAEGWAAGAGERDQPRLLPRTRGPAPGVAATLRGRSVRKPPTVPANRARRTRLNGTLQSPTDPVERYLTGLASAEGPRRARTTSGRSPPSAADRPEPAAPCSTGPPGWPGRRGSGSSQAVADCRPPPTTAATICVSVTRPRRRAPAGAPAAGSRSRRGA